MCCKSFLKITQPFLLLHITGFLKVFINQTLCNERNFLNQRKFIEMGFKKQIIRLLPQSEGKISDIKGVTGELMESLKDC